MHLLKLMDYLSMKREVKQWWSTIQPISTKQTITPLLYELF